MCSKPQDILALFRMRHDIDEVVGIAVDAKIETPPAIHARLPDIIGFIVFLGTQRRMAEVVDEQGDPPIKGLLNLTWRALIAAAKAFGVVEVHECIMRIWRAWCFFSMSLDAAMHARPRPK